MLIYRHLPPTPAVSGADGDVEVEEEATTSGHARTPALPPIPEHLLTELDTYNAEVQRERGEYERDRGLIDIMTYHARHFRILGGQIHKRITNTHSTAVRGAAAASVGKSDAAAADERDKKLLTLSKDTPVVGLVADIKEALGEADAGPVEKLRLDQVELRGTQLTFSGLSLLLSEIPAEATLETIGMCTPVALWSSQLELRHLILMQASKREAACRSFSGTERPSVAKLTILRYQPPRAHLRPTPS
jgi:hypothetical protein